MAQSKAGKLDEVSHATMITKKACLDMQSHSRSSREENKTIGLRPRATPLFSCAYADTVLLKVSSFLLAGD